MKKEDEKTESKEVKEPESKENFKEEEQTEPEKEENTKQKEQAEITKEQPVEKKESFEAVKPKKTKNKVIIVLICFIVVIALLFLSTFFAICNMNNSNIAQGIFVENIEVSDLTKDEINQLVNEKVDAIEEIEISYDNYETVIKLADIGVEVSGKDAIKDAISMGKTNNILVDNYQLLKAKLFKTKLDLQVQIDDTKFKEMLKNIEAEIPEAVKEYSYEIKEDELIITNGKAGILINEDKFKQQMIENIKEQFNGNSGEITIPTIAAEPAEIDIEKIYSEIHKEAQDAYIVEEPFELHKEENGVDFKLSMEEVKEILAQKDKESYTIPLKITKPKVAIKDLGDKLFKQNLSKYTTIYDSSNTNRASNIALAAKTINGTILLPGETFSYNGVLGNTTKEKGYKPGGAYVGGKIVQTYGGGICQVSSTLYNAVLYANLEIVERYNHSYSVSYVPAGRDATVSYGGKDFKFKNSRNYPIKIVANAKNGVVSISIVGIKEEKEYEIELTSTVLSTTPCTTVLENNANLEEGKQKVIQVGHSGQKSIAYKIVKYNGKTISKTVLSKDTYKPMNRIVQVGTKKVTTPAVTPNNPVPPQTPSTTPTPNVAGTTNQITGQ